jgi:hypothetical protein
MPGLEDRSSSATPDFISGSPVYQPGTNYEVCSWEEYEELWNASNRARLGSSPEA